MAVADDGGNSGQCRQFFRGALSIATGSNDVGLGIDTVCAPDAGTSFAVSFCSDAAGVDDDDLRSGGMALVSA